MLSLTPRPRSRRSRLLALGALSLVLSACGPTPEVPASLDAIDLSLFEQPACTANGLSISDLKPASPVDYLELRHYVSESPLIANARRYTSVLATAGIPCATAGDQAGCQAALSKLTASQGFHTSGGYGGIAYHYLVITQGDSVFSVSTWPELKQLLAPIDMPQESVLIAWAADYQIWCTDKKHGAVRPVADGYQVLAVTNPYPWRKYYEKLLHVDRAGHTTELLSQELQRP